MKLRLFDTSLERLHRIGLVVKSTYGVKPGKYLVRQVVRESEGLTSFGTQRVRGHTGLTLCS